MNESCQQFGLTLQVTQACNLCCTYCYSGRKRDSRMPWETGVTAITRAYRSFPPHGRLDLGFFGGEPLLEAERILEWMRFARTAALSSGHTVRFNLTTNGTITDRAAWEVMLTEELELAVSCDGTPTMHDRHRRTVQGEGTATRVECTMRQLLEAGKDFQVVLVVRPDNLAALPDGLSYLHSLGIRSVTPSLDLWTTWTRADGVRLQAAIQAMARLWRAWLPDFSLSWFDTKLAQVAHLPSSRPNTRCGFGSSEIAVAPSGRLYPCERLIGEDRPDQPLRLPGHALEGDDFLTFAPEPARACAACARCALTSACETSCRCSNFVRTGDLNRPDGLLCLLNKATLEAVGEVLDDAPPAALLGTKHQQLERPCYVR